MDDEIKAARVSMLAARREAEEAAAMYRRTVNDAVFAWRAQGLSLRACARRLGITDGALRDLLRPVGASRRRRKAPKPPTGGGTA